MKRPNSQSGVTMLLAVMIMSSLVLIVTTVAVLSIDQSRLSRATLSTEPAYVAANAGAEEALWKAKRSTLSTLADCTTPTAQTVGSNTYNTYCKSFEGGTYSIVSGTPTTILLYDPNNINGNIDLISYPYTSFTLTYRSGLATQASITRLDGSTTGLSPTSCTVSSASPTCTINISAVTANSEGRMSVSLTAGGNASVDANTNRGLPSNLNLASTACTSKRTALTSCNDSAQASVETYTRKVEVKLNNQ